VSRPGSASCALTIDVFLNPKMLMTDLHLLAPPTTRIQRP
jgi:hypothetical protein